MKKTILVSLLALLCVVSVDARARKQKTNAPKIEVPSVLPVAADSFSYAVGVLQAPSLKQYLMQQEGLDEDALNYFTQGLNAKVTKDEEDKILGCAAGIKIARMNRERVIPNIQEQFGGSDSTYVKSDLFVQGLTEYMKGQATYSDSLAQAIVERQQKYREEVLRCEGINWLNNNAKKTGVVTLPSGLQYEVLVKGTGEIPADSVEVEVNYEGQLIDGTVFDSSYKRGKTATFKPTGVIKGWTEALTMMPVGSTWMLYIPYNLAYGERGNRNIPPYSTLIFKVELVNIKK